MPARAKYEVPSDTELTHGYSPCEGSVQVENVRGSILICHSPWLRKLQFWIAPAPVWTFQLENMIDLTEIKLIQKKKK